MHAFTHAHALYNTQILHVNNIYIYTKKTNTCKKLILAEN